MPVRTAAGFPPPRSINMAPHLLAGSVSATPTCQPSFQTSPISPQPTLVSWVNQLREDRGKRFNLNQKSFLEKRKRAFHFFWSALFFCLPSFNGRDISRRSL